MIRGSLLAAPAKSSTGWEVRPGAGNRGAQGVSSAPVARQCVGRRKGRAGLSGVRLAGLGSDSVAQSRKGGVRVLGAGVSLPSGRLGEVRRAVVGQVEATGSQQLHTTGLVTSGEA